MKPVVLCKLLLALRRCARGASSRAARDGIDMIANKSADVKRPKPMARRSAWAGMNDADLVAPAEGRRESERSESSSASTPLLEAAFNSNTEMIKALLDAGADPNAAGADGQTPLMLVARGTPTWPRRSCCSTRARMRRPTESQRQQTALMWAAANSQGPMMRELLVERGADLDAKTATDLMTPLVSAEPRAQPRSPGGMTALMFASREGCLDCVKAMVEKGASIDLPDPEGVTPLSVGHLEHALRRGEVPDRARRERQPVGLVGPHAVVSGRRLRDAPPRRAPGPAVARPDAADRHRETPPREGSRIRIRS